MTNEKPIGKIEEIQRIANLYRDSSPKRSRYKRLAFDFLCWCRYKGNPFNPTKEMAVEYTETLKIYCSSTETRPRGLVAADVVRWANNEE